MRIPRAEFVQNCLGWCWINWIVVFWSWPLSTLLYSFSYNVGFHLFKPLGRHRILGPDKSRTSSNPQHFLMHGFVFEHCSLVPEKLHSLNETDDSLALKDINKIGIESSSTYAALYSKSNLKNSLTHLHNNHLVKWNFYCTESIRLLWIFDFSNEFHCSES